MDSTRTFVARLLAFAFLSNLFLYSPSAVKLLLAESPTTSILAPDAKVELLADGFKFTEGPACDDKGNVFFTDQPNDRICKWSTAGELTTYMQPCGRSNGLCFDAKGNLWACADEKNELWCISADKQVEVVVKEYNGKLLNAPNDLWIRPDGGIYFSDPFYKRNYWKRGPSEQDVQGVYYLTPDHKNLIRVADDLQQPNGLIGTPDGKTLYIADIRAKKTYRYTIEPDGSISDKEFFCDLGSDGMTIDEKGNIYLTGKGVTVFNPEGKQIQQIDIDAGWTANVCFGGKDRKTLFVTASDKLFGVAMSVRGVDSQ
ncbi:Gluconolactonase precursor [Planctomycetes bacterium CA13]|uniref:Gluconolactonase n=1 Tax=Novipirellula herctigrandis TaxID=2527986 RepID=A0A5C5ZD46_9BACT|nr:Gluconolactonase precursor [Planctomycetes bacterium CA13]